MSNAPGSEPEHTVDSYRYAPLQPNAFTRCSPNARRTNTWKRDIFAHGFSSTLDKVQILGLDTTGHTGCVNALSWAHDGNLLLSGGDDTTVRIWRMKSSGTDEQLSFTCQSVFETGHVANIFNAHMLPYSSRIATVAGDDQVRIFDAGAALSVSGGDGAETRYNASDCGLRVLRCHTDRTKRIVTEESPDLFLTVAEDGTVRQHDLRSPHQCRSGCPAPLVKLNLSLSTLSLSPLTPYQFVVAGGSPYGFLFDRRHAGRFIQEEWGVPISNESTTCVRMFGRRQRSPGEHRGNEHVTGSRMSSFNGHEVLLSYGSDAVYLYSTRDDAEVLTASPESSILQPNSKPESKGPKSPPQVPKRFTVRMDDLLSDIQVTAEGSTSGEDGDHDSDEADGDDEHMDLDSSSDNDKEDDENEEEELNDFRRGMQGHENVPVVFPRRRFSGHCNVETIKDVNFLGPSDEYVVSGSDDGNWFMWRKSTGALCGIYNGDDSVVNVIECHPYLPLVACSGIDYTVKLFAPVRSKSLSSRMANAENIISRNTQRSSARRISIRELLRHYSLALANRHEGSEDGDDEEPAECNYQ